MFKERNSTKKKYVTSPYSVGNVTLDARHQEMIQKYKERQENLQNVRETLRAAEERTKQLELRIQEFKQNKMHLLENPGPEYEKAWAEYTRSREETIRLQKDVQVLEQNLDEIDYFEKTSDILFDYYSLLTEQGDNPFHLRNIPPPQPLKRSKKAGPPPGKDILMQLKLFASPDPPPEAPVPPTPNHVDAAPSPEQERESDKKDKSMLVEEYLACIDPQQLRKVQHTDHAAVEQHCSFCNTVYTMNYYEGIMYCTNCGQQEVLLVEQNRPAQKQQSKEVSHFSYKRINHFNEWLSQLQGKETTEIPDDILDSILNEIRKERITDPAKITYAKMREILKRLKINKYYEHIPYIMNRIHGVPTPHFSPELEEKLRFMFREIQAPFLRHCPATRRNFLSYSYVLYKLCQLLEQTQYLKYFPLLKSREKLAAQDSIWKGICRDLGWSYIPSV